MEIKIPHEHQPNGRSVLLVGASANVNGVACRVIDSDDTHALLTPVSAAREVSDMYVMRR